MKTDTMNRKDPTLSCVFDMNLGCKVQLWLAAQSAALSDKFAMIKAIGTQNREDPLAQFSDLMNSTIDSANSSMSSTALAAFCQVCDHAPINKAVLWGLIEDQVSNK